VLPLALLLLLLLPLKDERPDAAEAAYQHALRLFQQGHIADAHGEATAGWARYGESEPAWAGKFQLLDAQALIYLEKEETYKQALNVLAGYSAPQTDTVGGQVEKLTYEASALMNLGKMHADISELKAANQKLDDAEALCGKAQLVACGGMWLARGSLAYKLGRPERALMFHRRALDFARAHKDVWRQANALMQLGFVTLEVERLDESVDWSRAGNALATQHGYYDLDQLTAGNLGLAWWKLGDVERAQEWLEAAQKIAAGLGDLDDEQYWLSKEVAVFRDLGGLNHDHSQLLHAVDLDEKSLELARKIGDPQGIVDALNELAVVELYTDKVDKADAHLKEAQQRVQAAKLAPSPFMVLIDGEISTKKQDYAKSEEDYRSLIADASAPMEVRLNAGNDLGRLYEAQGKFAPAERTYKDTIAMWAEARAQLKHEEAALAFGTNATLVYRNYVRFLIDRGRTGEALELADQIRARTLAAGLGVDGKAVALNPQQIARKTGATLLFYWLEEVNHTSFLWVVTPEKTALFKLPGESEIAAHVKSYRSAIMDLRDPVATANADGVFLYHALVEPTRDMVDAKKPVIVLADGALNELNFETLPVPEAAGKAHALIEDWELESAPSLDLLAHGEDAKAAGEQKMLLVGNPVTEDPKYPALGYFGTEMKRVAGHFDAGSVEVISGAKATPAAYVSANPAGYEFIHFVSHATASRTSPLDSAILLSRPDSKQVTASAANAGDGAGTYRLYAREIVAHPLNARLVTISACDGAGKRAYVGEGLVGLSWAFLRAGARQVVAALWEVSDDSTPALMDALYAGIAAGKTPAEALREAKLGLLHTKGKFRQPYYWAAFQIYSRE